MVGYMVALSHLIRTMASGPGTIQNQINELITTSANDKLDIM